MVKGSTTHSSVTYPLVRWKNLPDKMPFYMGHPVLASPLRHITIDGLAGRSICYVLDELASEAGIMSVPTIDGLARGYRC